MIIHKFILAITDEQMVEVGDRYARALSVGEQDGQLVLWAAVDPSHASDAGVLIIRIYGTGNPHSLRGRFIGTVQMTDGLVWHIFAEEMEKNA